MSYQWIWDTYSLLTAAHNLLTAVFVSVLQWDRSDEWPALFGNITDAYSGDSGVCFGIGFMSPCLKLIFPWSFVSR